MIVEHLSSILNFSAYPTISLTGVVEAVTEAWRLMVAATPLVASSGICHGNKCTECEPSQFFLFCARFESVCQL